MAAANNISFQTVKDICDVVSLIIACPEDSTYLLSTEPSSELWVLSIKNNTNVSWRECARRLFKEVYLNEAPELMRMIRMNKVWIPDNTPSAVFHVVYEIKCNSETKRKYKLANGRYRTRARWVTKSEVQKFSAHNGLRSPEIIQYITLVESDVVKTTTRDSKPLLDASQTLQEMESSENYFIDELTEMNLGVPDGPYLELVNAANFTKEDQHLIFREFLMNCFPALYMSESCFEKFLLDCGWIKADITRLFIAADIYNRGALSYKDFLYVLAATDPTTPHGGAPAELRCRYIFRFYDKNKTNVMDPIQFRELVETMRRMKKLSVDATSVNKEIEWHAKQIGVDKDTPLGLAEFLQAVGELKLRGTSVLLRCSKDYMSIIRDWQEREKVKPNRAPVANAKPSAPAPVAAVSASATAIPTVNTRAMKQIRQSPIPPGSRNPQASQTMDYELGMHCIKLKKFGAVVDIEQLVEMEGASVTPSTALPYRDAKNAARSLSMEMFSKKSQASELLTGLRYFVAYISGRDTKKVNQGHRTSKLAYSWGPVDPLGFANCLIQISSLVRECFNDESRLLNLQSPVYVMGDLHGNLPDLLGFEKVLWNLGPSLCPSTLLFLGDYVDRGPYGVEVIAYLFASKVQNTSKVRLLRGNHEIRDVQRMFTFLTECTNKFGDTVGKEVWNAINNAFDAMPIAAVIDGKVFCCHGGIPPPWLCPVITAVNDIPTPLVNPDEQSQLAWEILWNDPIKTNKMTETLALELASSEGFALNMRRGTAHVFTQQALDKFLQVNNLTHMIRAHEMAQSGVYIQYAGKLITVFTSSRYCGGDNEAACVFIQNGKIRIFRIDTNMEMQ